MATRKGSKPGTKPANLKCSTPDDRNRALAAAYVALGFNKVQAYLQVYPGTRYATAATSASQRFKEPEVMRLVEEETQKLHHQLRVDAARVLEEASRLAYSDVTALFDDRGNLLPIGQWPAHLRGAIGGIRFDKRGRLLGIKLWDKPKALELLARHLNIVQDSAIGAGDWDRLEAILRGARATTSRESR